MKLLKCLGLIILLQSALPATAQSFKFAFLSDTHIGGLTAAEDLRRTVQDINQNPELKFVVLTGDITEFGSDKELILAKQILDSLNKPWHIIPGNHDSNWSESGNNSFRKIFGAETFSFTETGYLFIGTSSGPNMRMGPGQVPRENIVWMDSVLNNMSNPDMPVIFLNHYPQDSSLNNWFEIVNRLKQRNIQLILCGHGHANGKYNFEGIPSVMGRSNLRAKDSIGGYNIVSIDSGISTFELRKPVVKTQAKWMEVSLFNHNFKAYPTIYPRPNYDINTKFTQVKELWTYQDKSDIGSGFTVNKDMAFAANTSGTLYALNLKSGKLVWRFQTYGKIYSSPTLSGNYLVVGSSDNYIYCVDPNSGKPVWKYLTLKPVLGSPIISGNQVFIGGSDGHFRALNLKTGKLIWDFADVKGFIVSKPLLYRNHLYFGTWSNNFYALDILTGKLIWQWSNGSLNSMFSPAACYPVATNGKLFIVAPDRYMTVLDYKTGHIIWREKRADTRVRESMGLSIDSSMIYVKTMDGSVKGISTRADSMQVQWVSKLKLPYELAPTAIIESDGVVYVPSHSGLISAVDRQTGDVLWQHKLSNSLINPITITGKNRILVSSMDGKIVHLQYSPNKL